MIDIRDVMQFAMKAHGNQMYGDLPYITHLSDVYRVLLRHGIQDLEILSTAWLHDVLEDTEYHYNDIVKLTNKSVAEMVYAITDEMGRNRKERKEKTWPKLIKNEKAVVVKQADMLANVNQGILEKNGLLGMYKKEFPKFKEYFGEHGCMDLWRELIELLEDDYMSHLEKNNLKYNTIKIWDWDNAPKEYTKLSENGGDEDWIAFVPISYKDKYIGWLAEGSAFGCCCVDKHEVKNGTIYIGCHA